MKAFTFYPYSAAGTALMFDARDLPDRESARAHAQRVLDEHATAERVDVWADDELAFTLHAPQN